MHIGVRCDLWQRSFKTCVHTLRQRISHLWTVERENRNIAFNATNEIGLSGVQFSHHFPLEELPTACHAGFSASHSCPQH